MRALYLSWPINVQLRHISSYNIHYCSSTYAGNESGKSSISPASRSTSSELDNLSTGLSPWVEEARLQVSDPSQGVLDTSGEG